MNEQGRLSVGASMFLLTVAILADGAKILLDLLFGIGFILDPLFITPVTTAIFWITLNHKGISMFSGKYWAVGWANEIVSLIPGIDIVPDWTVYTIYLIAHNRLHDSTQGIME